MSWPMFWSVLGVVTTLCLLMAPVLYVLMRRELRKAFRPLVEDLDSIAVRLDIMQTRLDRIHKRVHALDDDLSNAREDGQEEPRT